MTSFWSWLQKFQMALTNSTKSISLEASLSKMSKTLRANGVRSASMNLGDSTSLQRECSARARSRTKHPGFETIPRHDRLSKDQPKRVENDRDRSL